MQLTRDAYVAGAGRKTSLWQATEIFRSPVTLRYTQPVLLIKESVPKWAPCYNTRHRNREGDGLCN